MSTDVGSKDSKTKKGRQSGRVEHLTEAERVAQGKAARGEVPRSAHAEWEPPADRPSPVSCSRSRPRRGFRSSCRSGYGRMLVSPFTFYRGAAYLMASDLSAQPRTGLHVQLCGDAHLSNFGAFAAPDRRLVFSINDFDETHPGPFEWDVKRLVASFAVAGRDRGFDDKQRASVNLRCRTRLPRGDDRVRRTGQPRPLVHARRRRGSARGGSADRDGEAAQARTAEPGEDAGEGQPEGIRQADRDRRRRAADRRLTLRS